MYRYLYRGSDPLQAALLKIKKWGDYFGYSPLLQVAKQQYDNRQDVAARRQQEKRRVA